MKGFSCWLVAVINRLRSSDILLKADQWLSLMAELTFPQCNPFHDVSSTSSPTLEERNKEFPVCESQEDLTLVVGRTDRRITHCQTRSIVDTHLKWGFFNVKPIWRALPWWSFAESLVREAKYPNWCPWEHQRRLKGNQIEPSTGARIFLLIRNRPVGAPWPRQRKNNFWPYPTSYGRPKRTR